MHLGKPKSPFVFLYERYKVFGREDRSIDDTGATPGPWYPLTTLPEIRNSKVTAQTAYSSISLLARRQNQAKRLQSFRFNEELQCSETGEVVEDDSSVLSRYPHRGIHANYINMTKFGGPEDAG